MSDLLPLATYNLKVDPFKPTPAINISTPVTARLTLAAVDPEAVDEDGKPSTLKIIKRNPEFADDDDDILGDYDEDEVDVEEEEEEKEEKAKGKGKRKSKGKENQKKKTVEEEEDDEDDDYYEEDEDDEFQEYVIVTLSPKGQMQQTLDLTIAPEEEILFVVEGSYPIHLSGNFVKHPFDDHMDGYYSDDGEEDDDDEEDEDEDELDDDYEDALDELEDASDVEGRIEEMIEDEKEQKGKKENDDEDDEDEDEDDVEEEVEEEIEVEEEKPKKKSESNKKRKAEEEESNNKKQKKVQFKKDLEEGPTNKKAIGTKTEKKQKKVEEAQKVKTQVLEGGIIIEDRVTGTGKKAKRGDKIGMRYVGKLKKNGKVFDKNTKGKPFVFKLGRGEVIKGWDIGVAGMCVGGERRIIIPAAYAYGTQALPGIPGNSDLTFDVKLVSMK
ncbi:related to FK506-binding protein 3 [Saccharomycodes ludwigii]|uniref:FK506-binding protein n=1 Tax=Saccharomycodes ludwigii TaxID=36035 RepID=A0A376B5G5_9ASCO|nr:hypothetical protein SCDLUD_004350 [Saccharomycodes ludwigii]KAH3900033.1 hypothetical protein SCDLUD_004350 [Saccharomycodes ludwigii]SSD59862.1 related to FK506-binding protein 3 [Saccharomycodes ludwigii]